jgi:hypothetical protein
MDALQESTVTADGHRPHYDQGVHQAANPTVGYRDMLACTCRAAGNTNCLENPGLVDYGLAVGRFSCDTLQPAT